MANWNPWHGCKKYSPGCQNCYVYRIDARHDRDASRVYRTQSFSDPVRQRRDGSWKFAPGDVVWTCFSSDFLLDEADEWRPEAWTMMRRRSDLNFFFLTKRIERLAACLPPDWGEGYPNVGIGCTCENQDRADFRLPIFLTAPIRHKTIACEPLLGPIDLSPYLNGDIAQVLAGGESGPSARLRRYEWVLSLRQQCVAAGVPFLFKQTGARFEKDGRVYAVPRRLQHAQARKAGIEYRCCGFLPAPVGRKPPPADLEYIGRLD